MPPWLTWTWPPGIGSLMTGALMTWPSRTMAKYFWVFAEVCFANLSFPSDLRVKSTVRRLVASAPMEAAASWSPEKSTQL